MNILDTGIKLVKNVNRYNFGFGSIKELNNILSKKRSKHELEEREIVIFFIDSYFEKKMELLNQIDLLNNDKIFFVNTDEEPKTDRMDYYVNELIERGFSRPCAIVGIGGGITMDTSKAISNLLTNGGKAEDYQGWDLLKKPGIFKIGVPTISGTGAEATRTCVMTNTKTGLKLGMNSDFTVFDHIIMDPKLTETVDRNQYFYTGMDAYIHCVETLNGSYRNAIGDAYSRETIRLCREVFNSNDMMSNENREKLMIASYLGGCAIATSYVGVIHPVSAGLSVVLGLHHCVANCITMRAMNKFYPKEYEEYWSFVEKQNIEIPKDVCEECTEDEFRKLCDSTLIHEKPLTNALGTDFKKILTYEKIKEIFKSL